MMRKNLFHPTQFYQQHELRTRGSNQLGDLYATQPEHVVHSVLYRIDEQDQELINNRNLSEINNGFRK